MILNQFSRAVLLSALLTGCSQIDQFANERKSEVQNFFLQRRYAAEFAEQQIAVLRKADLTKAQRSHDVCAISSYYRATRSLEKGFPWHLMWGQYLSMNSLERSAEHKKATEALASELTIRIRLNRTSFNCSTTLEASTIYGVVKTLERLILEEELTTTVTTPEERHKALVESAKTQTGQLYLQWQYFHDGKWCTQAQRLLTFIEEDRLGHEDLGLDVEGYQDMFKELLEARKNMRVLN